MFPQLLLVSFELCFYFFIFADCIFPFSDLPFAFRSCPEELNQKVIDRSFVSVSRFVRLIQVRCVGFGNWLDGRAVVFTYGHRVRRGGNGVCGSWLAGFGDYTCGLCVVGFAADCQQIFRASGCEFAVAIGAKMTTGRW